MADSTLQNGMTPGGADKNGMAVASLVLGIIAVCCCCVSGLSLVLGILAIVFSIQQRVDWEQLVWFWESLHLFWQLFQLSLHKPIGIRQR